MTNEQDSQMVIDLHYMAAEFDNQFLRMVADRLSELLKEKEKNAKL